MQGVGTLTTESSLKQHDSMLFPKSYPNDADEIEIVFLPRVVLIMPRKRRARREPFLSTQFSFLGIAGTRNPSAPFLVDDILGNREAPEEDWGPVV